MEWTLATGLRWLFDSERGASDRLLPRWIFLRALGLIYYSAFFSLVFQIRGLIGPHGILPAGEYLQAVAERFGHAAYWYAPTLLWFSSSAHVLAGICWVGMIASLLLVLNLWPRGMLAICSVCFLSFVSAAQEFSGYHRMECCWRRDLSRCFSRRQVFGRGGGRKAGHRAQACFCWFGKASGFISNRVLRRSWAATRSGGTSRRSTSITRTAAADVDWLVYAASAAWVHAVMSFGTLALELVLAWMMFLPRRIRIVCFFIVTPWQIGIILSANYTFLNYLVLVLGFLLLDDRFVLPYLPRFMKESYLATKEAKPLAAPIPENKWRKKFREQFSALKLALTAVMLTWIYYVDAGRNGLDGETSPAANFAGFGARAVSHRKSLRIVRGDDSRALRNRVSGLGRWTNVAGVSISIQTAGSKQSAGDLRAISAAVRLEFVFASLSSWRQEPIVLRTEQSLLRGDRDVLLLFAGTRFRTLRHAKCAP